MKTSILQSMLARNKQAINGKVAEIHFCRNNRQYVINNLKNPEIDFDDEEREDSKECVLEYNKRIAKQKKDIKQLAAIQKAIKEEIRMNDGMDSYLLMLAMRD